MLQAYVDRLLKSLLDSFKTGGLPACLCSRRAMYAGTHAAGPTVPELLLA